MATITQFPRGLVSLTGLRDMGEAPRELAELIAPTIDVTQFLLLTREQETIAVTINAVGIYTNITVPAGELWYVHSFGVISNPLAAGNTLQFNLGFTLNGFFTSWSNDSTRSNTAGDRITTGIHTPVFIGPGTSLSALIMTFAGANVDVRFTATVSKLRI